MVLRARLFKENNTTNYLRAQCRPLSKT